MTQDVSVLFFWRGPLFRNAIIEIFFWIPPLDGSDDEASLLFFFDSISGGSCQL